MNPYMRQPGPASFLIEAWQWDCLSEEMCCTYIPARAGVSAPRIAETAPSTSARLSTMDMYGLFPLTARNHEKRLGACTSFWLYYSQIPFEILLAPEAVQDLKHLKAHHRMGVCDAIEVHLRHEPTKTSKSRIKRLRGISRPQSQLRVGDTTAFLPRKANWDRGTA